MTAPTDLVASVLRNAFRYAPAYLARYASSRCDTRSKGRDADMSIGGNGDSIGVWAYTRVTPSRSARPSEMYAVFLEYRLLDLVAWFLANADSPHFVCPKAKAGVSFHRGRCFWAIRLGTPVEIVLSGRDDAAGRNTMIKALTTFVNDDRGVDLIEYALLAGLVGIAAVTTLGDIGTKVKNIFISINTKLPVITP